MRRVTHTKLTLITGTNVLFSHVKRHIGMKLKFDWTSDTQCQRPNNETAYLGQTDGLVLNNDSTAQNKYSFFIQKVLLSFTEFIFNHCGLHVFYKYLLQNGR